MLSVQPRELTKILLINLQINTQENRFHELSIDQKSALIEEAIFRSRPPSAILNHWQPFDTILVAPEYFFARCCPEADGISGRHYEYYEYIKIREKLTALSKKYPKVLFIPGTIAWKTPILRGELAEIPQNIPRNAAPVPAWRFREFNSEADYNRHMLRIGEVNEQGHPIKNWENYEREAPDDDMLEVCRLLKTKFNFYYGGAARLPNEKINILYNRVMDTGINPDTYIENIRAAIRGIKFAYNAAYFYLNGKKVGEYKKHSDFQEDFETAKEETAIAINDDGPSVLNIYGLRIGTEICLDHACDILLQHLERQYLLNPLPYIHLILSATVNNRPLIPGIPIRIHSSSCQGNTQIQEIGNRISNFSSLTIRNGNVCIMSAVLSVDLEPNDFRQVRMLSPSSAYSLNNREQTTRNAAIFAPGSSYVDAISSDPIRRSIDTRRGRGPYELYLDS